MKQPPHQPRRQYLADAKVQLSIVLPMLGCIFAFTLVYAVAFAASSDAQFGPTSDTLVRLGVLVTGVYFLLSVLATVLVGVVVTHRVAGPAKLIEAAVRGMREKDYTQRLTFRERDLLHPLATELSALRDELKREDSVRDAVRAALDRGDLEAARRLLAQPTATVAASEERDVA